LDQVLLLAVLAIQETLGLLVVRVAQADQHIITNKQEQI
jgi:hypothetical protein